MIKKNSISSKNVRAVREETKRFLKVASRIKEASPATGGRSEDAGWRPITGKKVDRDLSPVTQDKMQNIAVWLYDSDPIAKRIIDLKRDFLVGEEVKATAEDKTVDEIIQDFWYDPINNMPMFVPDMARDLGLFGEQALPTFVNKVNGHVRLGYLDPCMIDRVVTDPDNCRIPIGIIVKSMGSEFAEMQSKERDFVTVWQSRQGIPTSVIDNGPKSYSIIGLNRNVHDIKGYGKLTGDAFFFTINKVTNATRGRSDLLSLADWIHNYETFLFNRIERARLLNCFLWDVELTGFTQLQIDNWLSKQSVPKPASIRAHNEKVKWDTVSPELESNDASNEAVMFRAHIAGGAGIPVHWLGGGEGLTRATALEMSTPVFKHLKQRQLYLKNILTNILDYVIDCAIIAGRLKPDVNRKFNVIFPALSPKDLMALSTTITGVANALVIAKDAKLITQEEASTHLRVVLNLLGGDMVLNPEELPEDTPAETPQVGKDVVTKESLKLYGKTKRGK